MSGERFVVLGLAGTRAPWFRNLARLATTGALPMEIVLCLSADEVAARLTSGRVWSALLIDGDHPGLDRDLVDRAHRTRCAVLVVSAALGRDFGGIGVDGILAADFGRDDLLGQLETTTAPIRPADNLEVGPSGSAVEPPGNLIAVTGPGGTGASTVSMAISQGCGRRRVPGAVVLADLKLWSEHAMLHGTPDVIPGLPELVDGHRAGTMADAEIRSLVYNIASRGYHLLLGMRRHRDWASLRPRAIGAAIAALQRCYDLVVADVDSDVDGYQRTGSHDLEERNHLNRASLAAADVVVVVGAPSMKGVHALVRCISDLVEHGVPSSRLLPVLNQVSPGPIERSRLTRSVSELCRPVLGQQENLHPAVFVPSRRGLEAALRDATPIPAAITDAVTGPVERMLERLGPRDARSPVDLVIPGSIGHWGTEEAAS